MKKLNWVIFVIMILYIIFLQECRNPSETIIEKEPIIERYDSIIYETDTVYKIEPHIVYKDTGSFHIEYLDVDTNKIIEDYLSIYRVYNDTIINDTNAFVYVIDTINRNRLFSRNVYKKFKANVIVIKKEKIVYQQKKLRFLFGGGVYGNMDAFGFKAGVSLLSKNNNIYQLEYDPINRYLFVSMYWSINKK